MAERILFSLFLACQYIAYFACEAAVVVHVFYKRCVCRVAGGLARCAFLSEDVAHGLCICGGVALVELLAASQQVRQGGVAAVSVCVALVGYPSKAMLPAKKNSR